MFNKWNPLDEAIFIILTTQTNEANYLKTWQNFRRRFPTWENAVKARNQEIARAIKTGGLSKWKAERIKNLLRQVSRKNGKLSLSFLKRTTPEEAERFLVSLDGLGIKTARCIMLYSLGHPVFPIDTHTFKVFERIGLISMKVNKRSKQTHDAMQDLIEPKLRLPLHVGLVKVGREFCHARKPNCLKCPLRLECSFGSKTAAIVNTHSKN